MIALVALQGYWIKTSMDAKEQQFGQTIHQVFQEVSDELLENETAMEILEELQPPLIQHQSKAVWNFRIDARSSYSVIDDEDIQLDQNTLHYSSPHSSLKNRTAELIDDSILVIVAEDELLNDTLLVSAMRPDQIRVELSKSMQDPESFVNRIVRKMMVDEETIMNHFTGDRIETLLRKKLHEKGIDVPFEYAVYEEGKKPYFNSPDFNEYEDVPYFRSSLFPKGIFNKATLISVYFPGRKDSLVGSLGLLGGTSILITLFLLMLFSLALYIIFKQKRLSEMKNDFVNNMTHELKTPISTISLASQMLSDRTIPDEQKNLVQISRIIKTESSQLGFQVERVLQMAIFDHGQLKLKSEQLDLHDVIETVAQNFLFQLEKREGKVEFFPEAEQTIILGDSMHITNVVSNLIENAIKYTQRSPEIKIETGNDEDTILLSVTDNGIGIGKEDQKRIFDKFYRVPTGNVHNVKGFGLGLSYVKLIVEQHGGTIGVKSEPGKGSRFEIHLPLYQEKSQTHDE